jgi:hypothetical protein
MYFMQRALESYILRLCIRLERADWFFDIHSLSCHALYQSPGDHEQNKAFGAHHAKEYARTRKNCMNSPDHIKKLDVMIPFSKQLPSRATRPESGSASWREAGCILAG